MQIRNVIPKINSKKFCWWSFLMMLIGAIFVSDSLHSNPKNQVYIKVRIGNDVITNIDIDDRCRMIALLSSREDDASFMKSIKKQVIQRLVDEVLYEQLAKQGKIEPDEADVENGIADYAQRFQLKTQQFKEELRKKHLLESFRKMVRAKIISSYLLATALPKEFADVTEEQIDGEIEKINQDANRTSYFISEIVFCSRSNSSKEASVKSAAQQTYKELVRMSQKISSAEAFHILAQQLSQGPTASDGGVRGWVSKGQMDPDTAKAIMQLSIGQFSKPILIRNGEYRIFLLQDIKKPGQVPYSQARLSLCRVTIPFNKTLPQPAQEAIERRVASLMDCHSAAELQSMAKEFGYASSIIEKRAGTVAIPVSDLHFNTCWRPFFTGQSLDLYMPLSLSYPQVDQVDRSAIKNELIFRKKSAEADKILRNFKTQVFTQEYQDN